MTTTPRQTMTFQAITTRYHGPTNTRAARISARADAGRLSLPWDHALSPDQNHRKAAETLAARYGWLDYSTLWGAALPGPVGGMAWVMIHNRDLAPSA